MFGLGDMNGMIKEVAEFKALFERFVVATEENSRKLDLLLADREIKDTPVIEVQKNG